MISSVKYQRIAYTKVFASAIYEALAAVQAAPLLYIQERKRVKA